ncbi:MAG TPA: hypothetical protein G4O09_04005 [Dehalococcoidia bacterium]|nr:hypothetical protein [Dehalococcoidia bacterium]
MRIYNRYVISLALAFCVINAALAFLGQNDLGLYLAINIIAYLVITVLYVYLNPRARRALGSVSVVLFGGIVVIAVLKVMEIISGR